MGFAPGAGTTRFLKVLPTKEGASVSLDEKCAQTFWNRQLRDLCADPRGLKGTWEGPAVKCWLLWIWLFGSCWIFQVTPSLSPALGLSLLQPLLAWLLQV